MTVEWCVRGDDHATPGVLVAERARSEPQPPERSYAWVVGESSMAVGMRRHWVTQGTAKADVTFCGYWKKQH